MRLVEPSGEAWRVITVEPPMAVCERTGDTRYAGLIFARSWIDFRDGPTRGAALDVVREKLREPLLIVRHVGGRGWEAVGFAAPVAFFSTEAAALVAAMEAAK